jgi:hypothetical protein
MIGANKGTQQSALSSQPLKRRGKEQENLNREYQVPPVESCLADVSAAIYRKREKHGQQG